MIPIQWLQNWEPIDYIIFIFAGPPIWAIFGYYGWKLGKKYAKVLNNG